MRGASVDEFEWPCDRRDAHHPHPIENTMALSDEAMAAHVLRGEEDCPGVGAHPLTQIGGAYKPGND